jgi:hypothetical protein
MKQNNFIFSKYEFIDTTLKLYYNTDDYEFIEEIDFHKKPDDSKKEALDLAFKYLHLTAGISYYKIFLPENIIIKTCDLDKQQADFFNNLYFNGLGEFSYRNQVLLNINFPYKKVDNIKSNLKLSNTSIVPIGGGKDSLIAYEIAKKQNKDIKLFSVNLAKPIKDCIDFICGDHLNNILVDRKIAPTLLDLVKNNIGYNGHIPISAIIAFISVCVGIIYDCNETVIANEKSANVGNVEWQGRLINHQYSKSEEAETNIRNFIQKYIVDFNYYSILRPYYEVAIAKKFSELKQYHSIFSSCNKNFKISAEKIKKVWCCDCPKCRFVYLILAPYIKKQEMIDIFGKNLFEEEKQLKGYKELTGLNGYKPFECVGEIEESVLSFLLLENTEFENDFIVKEITKQLKEYNLEKLKIIYLKNKLQF